MRCSNFSVSYYDTVLYGSGNLISSMPWSIYEVWSRRSLIITLAFTDLKLRYRNSVLGFSWSFLEPLLMLTVLYLVFTNIFKGTIEHYPLFLLLGLITWNMFSRGTHMGMDSILNKAGLVSKTYLPREVVVVSGVLTSFFMMLLEMIVFFIFMVGFQVIPADTVIILPLMLPLLFILTLGVSLALSSLYVYFRDIRSIWTVVLQTGFFLSTVMYKIDIFPKSIRPIISLNPLIPFIDTLRDATIYAKWPDANNMAYLVVVVFAVFAIGYAIFKRLDRRIIEEL